MPSLPGFPFSGYQSCDGSAHILGWFGELYGCPCAIFPHFVWKGRGAEHPRATPVPGSAGKLKQQLELLREKQLFRNPDLCPTFTQIQRFRGKVGYSRHHVAEHQGCCG